MMDHCMPVRHSRMMSPAHKDVRSTLHRLCCLQKTSTSKKTTQKIIDKLVKQLPRCLR